MVANRHSNKQHTLDDQQLCSVTSKSLWSPSTCLPKGVPSKKARHLKGEHKGTAHREH